jgi:hypothetical protein
VITRLGLKMQKGLKSSFLIYLLKPMDINDEQEERQEQAIIKQTQTQALHFSKRTCNSNSLKYGS